jgi:hypothetical protein
MVGSGARTAEPLDVLEPFSDDELSALALAADPDAPVGDDAVCLWDLTGTDAVRLVPDWYMPSPMGGARPLTGWRRLFARCNIALIIGSFLVINAYGLCNTYGTLHI